MPNHWEETNFYDNKSVDEIIEYMQVITKEWVKNSEEKDEDVRSKELPLVKAFLAKATDEDMKKYENILDEFMIMADDGKAIDLIREKQGKPKSKFPPVFSEKK